MERSGKIIQSHVAPLIAPMMGSFFPFWRNSALPTGVSPSRCGCSLPVAACRNWCMEDSYPCFFDQAAERTGQMFYAFIIGRSPSLFAYAMRQFVELLATRSHARFSLPAFFQPDTARRITRALSRDAGMHCATSTRSIPIPTRTIRRMIR